jgi:tetratricopeptide (TPR) repeat protein
MPQKTSSLEKFWKELKRRRVVSVVTTYAATAYIVIEVTNNLVEPLSLPAWIAKLVILLLVAGLPIVIILSWIFEFTPQGIKKTESIEESVNGEILVKPVKRKLRASYVLNGVLIIAVIVLAYPNIFRHNTLEKLRSSGKEITITVMPFQNMTNDTIWNVWQEGIQDILINSFSNSEELRPRQAQFINDLVNNQKIANYASITQSLARTISQKLDANVFIYGNIKQAGKTLRLSAQLVDSESEEVFKAFQIEGASSEEKIFQLADSLSVEIRNFLIISKIKQDQTPESHLFVSTNSPEAFRYFLNGRNLFNKQQYSQARSMFFQALAIDSNIYMAFTYISRTYYNAGIYEQSKRWCLKAYSKKEMMPMTQKQLTNWLYANNFQTPQEEVIILKDLLKTDDFSPTIHFILGDAYKGLHVYDKAIPEYEKSLEILKKWELKPQWIYNYSYLGEAYHKTGNYKKEKRCYEKAGKDFPDDPVLTFRKAVLALSEGNSVKADKLIEKFISIAKENSGLEAEIADKVTKGFSDEASIAGNLANIFSEANIPNKAEEYFRQALSLEPENPARINDLAYFLIDKDRNINEGLELSDKALKLNPENFDYMDTKGWGLFKQGKFHNALDILQKSWKKRREQSIYDQEAFLHLEAAKKAVARLK